MNQGKKNPKKTKKNKKRFNVFINDTIDIKRTFDSKLKQHTLKQKQDSSFVNKAKNFIFCIWVVTRNLIFKFLRTINNTHIINFRQSKWKNVI